MSVTEQKLAEIVRLEAQFGPHDLGACRRPRRLRAVKADMDEAIRLGVEALQKILSLREEDRFAALWELWPGFIDDDFRQMSQTSDIGLDRLARSLGWIAAGYVGPPDPDDEIMAIDDVELSPDNEESDDDARDQITHNLKRSMLNTIALQSESRGNSEVMLLFAVAIFFGRFD